MDAQLRAIGKLRVEKAIEGYLPRFHAKCRESKEISEALSRRYRLDDDLLFELRAASVEEIGRSIADIWAELLTKKNGGLARDDIQLIMQEVESFTHSIAPRLNGEGDLEDKPAHLRKWMTQKAQDRARRIAGDIRRDLEIRFLEQEAFPAMKEEKSERVSLVIQHANIANLNLGHQEGVINAALQALSSEDSERKALANAIKQLTDGVVADRRLSDDQKKEAVDALTVIANDAKSGTPSVSTKSLLSYFPSLIGLSADLLTLWDHVSPLLKAHFGF